MAVSHGMAMSGQTDQMASPTFPPLLPLLAQLRKALLQMGVLGCQHSIAVNLPDRGQSDNGRADERPVGLLGTRYARRNRPV